MLVLNRPSVIAVLWMTLCAAVVLSAPGLADAARLNNEDAKRIDLATGKQLNAAIEALNARRYDEANAILSKMNMGKLSSYEQSRVYQIFAAVAGAKNDYGGVRKSMQSAIASGGLDQEEQQLARYQIAQACMVQEFWQGAVDGFNEWLANATDPSPITYHRLALAYYEMGKLDDGLMAAAKSVDLSKEPKESWLLLLLAMRLEKGQYAEAKFLLEQLMVVGRINQSVYREALSSVQRKLGSDE